MSRITSSVQSMGGTDAVDVEPVAPDVESGTPDVASEPVTDPKEKP